MTAASPRSASRSLAFRREAALINGVIAALALVVALTAAARSAPPENADPTLAPWFQSLEVPGTNHSSCCSQSDCRPVDYRVINDYYEALLTPEQFARAGVMQSRWIRVPYDRILQRVDNPTGKAILCWQPGTGVLCFIRPDET
jgi:hypothetical protein